MTSASTLSKLTPRRILRRGRAVMARLNAVCRSIAGSRGPTPEIQQLLEGLERRLGQMVTSEVGRVIQSQESELKAAVTDGFAMLKSWNLDYWKLQELEGLLRYLRRRDYLRAMEEGRLAVPQLETDHPIAIASNDTKFPRGSKNDNSIALRFNNDWLRGAGQCRGDWHEDDGMGSHVVLKRMAASKALERSGPGWRAAVA